MALDIHGTVIIRFGTTTNAHRPKSRRGYTKSNSQKLRAASERLRYV